MNTSQELLPINNTIDTITLNLTKPPSLTTYGVTMQTKNVVRVVLSLTIMLYGVMSLPSSTALGAGTSTYTAFVVQNLGGDTANIVVEYRNTAGGSPVATSSGITVTVGGSISFDQRFESALGSSFLGNAVVSSDQPMGAVVNIGRTATVAGAVPAVESYNGTDQSAVGQSLRIPQVLKGVSSAGLVYNTEMSIQNTDLSNSATVTITFSPDPTLNPIICTSPAVCISSPFVKTSITIQPGGVYVLNQANQPNTEIGDRFYGSAQVASNRNVAVQTTLTGATSVSNLDQTLNAIPTYSNGSTSLISVPAVYKNIVSLGDSYSTAFLISNFSGSIANVTITYTNSSGVQVGSADVLQVQPNAVLNVDQRTATALAGDATFFGSARVSSNQPIRVMVNLRGGSRYAMTYDSLYGGNDEVYLPVAYKFISSQGYSYSSSAIISNFGSTPATVFIDYRDLRAGKPSALNQGPIIVTDTVAVDLRFSATTAGLPDFFGSIVIRSTNGQPIGAIVQTRGAGGSGDVLFAYKGFGKDVP